MGLGGLPVLAGRVSEKQPKIKLYTGNVRYTCYMNVLPCSFGIKGMLVAPGSATFKIIGALQVFKLKLISR